MDFVKNQKYFKKQSVKLPVIVMIIGIIGVCAGFGGSGASWVLGGIALIGIAILVLVLKAKNTPADAYIDEQINREFTALQEKALQKHGLALDQVQKIEPIVLGGYMIEAALVEAAIVAETTKTAVGAVVSGHASKEEALEVVSALQDSIKGIQFKKGKDGNLRASAVEWTIMLFSENQLFVYTEEFSLISQERKEASEEYSYRDIVSVSTETVNSYHRFTIKIIGGDEKVIPYSTEDASVSRSISTLKQLIREKKNA